MMMKCLSSFPRFDARLVLEFYNLHPVCFLKVINYLKNVELIGMRFSVARRVHFLRKQEKAAGLETLRGGVTPPGKAGQRDDGDGYGPLVLLCYCVLKIMTGTERCRILQQCSVPMLCLGWTCFDFVIGIIWLLCKPVRPVDSSRSGSSDASLFHMLSARLPLQNNSLRHCIGTTREQR